LILVRSAPIQAIKGGLNLMRVARQNRQDTNLWVKQVNFATFMLNHPEMLKDLIERDFGAQASPDSS